MSGAASGMRERRYHDIPIGEVCEFERTITDADVKAFAALVGEDAARADGDVPEALIAAQLSALVGMELPGKYALYLSQDLKFFRPVTPGQSLKVRGEVIDKTDVLRLLVIRTDILTDRGDAVATGTAKVTVLEPFREVRSEGAALTLDLSGKTALVTGASRGIGAATAVLLARHGARVVVNYDRDEAGARAVMDHLESFSGTGLVIQADISRPDDVEHMVDVAAGALGPIDILVNNASPPVRPQSFLQGTWDEYQRHLDVVLKGAFHCTRAVVPGMVSRGAGSIINVVTTYTVGAPPPNIGPYVTAKSALVGFTRALAVELGPRGIRVNAVSPGLTDTSLAAHLPQRFKDVVAAQAPLRRIAVPEDVARVVLMLASEAGSFMTGVTIPVCGGHVMA